MKEIPKIAPSEMIWSIQNLIKDCKTDLAETGYYTLERRDNKIWGIVVGWNEGFDKSQKDEFSRGDCRLCMKMAYMPANSLMSEYTTNWMYPEYPGDKNQELMDTEISIYPDTDIEKAINDLLKQYRDLRLMEEIEPKLHMVEKLVSWTTGVDLHLEPAMYVYSNFHGCGYDDKLDRSLILLQENKETDFQDITDRVINNLSRIMIDGTTKDGNVDELVETLIPESVINELLNKGILFGSETATYDNIHKAWQAAVACEDRETAELLYYLDNGLDHGQFEENMAEVAYNDERENIENGRDEREL